MALESAKVQSLAFHGVEMLPVWVEASIASGLPAFTLVGLPNKAVTESKERVRSALQALGVAPPAKRVTINLAPADLPKEGSHFDLPIALTMLQAMKVIDPEALANCLVLGELSLDGSLVPVSGVLAAALNARRAKQQLVCPSMNAKEASVLLPESQIVHAEHFSDLVNILRGQGEPAKISSLAPPVNNPRQLRKTAKKREAYDLADVKGQLLAKRALLIAAAGGHSLLMVGPPGAGKSMLAKRLPTILPNLDLKSSIEASVIHSLAGLLERADLIEKSPFRDPHHSASLPALIGGGPKAKPGEISLAHGGILFLDELPEFSPKTLDAMRQPLEDEEVLIARVQSSARYPARFHLVAAMNPCRCGHAQNPDKRCSRFPTCCQHYAERISGPLMDRFDLMIYMDLPKPHSNWEKGQSSAEVQQLVSQARQQQYSRYSDSKGLPINARVEEGLFRDLLNIADDAREILDIASEKLQFSDRAYNKLLRVGQTIADLANSPRILRPHMAEALALRTENRLGKVL